MKQELTERSVKKLAPAKHGSYVRYDTEIHGFGVRVTDKGTKTFILNYSLRGVERRCTIGFFPKEHSAASAKEKAGQLRQQIREGVDPIAQREDEERERDAKERSEHTVADLAQRYLEIAAEEKRATTLRNDKSMLAGIILPRLGSLRVNAVSQRDVETLFHSLRATPYRANRVLYLLSAMFTRGIGWGWASANPARVKSKKFPGIVKYPEKKIETWLTEDQLSSLEKALASYPGQDAANAIRLLIETGSRCGEVLGAKWEQFDLKRRTWTKPSESTKQKTTEHVPLSDAALAVLKRMAAQRSASPFLFPGVGTGKARVTIRRAWVAVCRAAGLVNEIKIPGKRRELTRYKPTVRPHDLRHTFASHLVSSGVSLPIIGNLLGHRQSSTTQRYAHIADAAARSAANRFGNRDFAR